MFLTLALLLALLAILGGAGVVLLHRLGGRIDAILRENYDSVRAMERLNEAAERIDSSFKFALADRKQEKGARDRYRENWRVYREQLDVESKNITIFPEELRLVKELDRLTDDYAELGDRFFARPADAQARKTDYSGTTDKPGLEALFRAIKGTATAILQLNQKNMEDASRDAKDTARLSIVALTGAHHGGGGAGVIGGLAPGPFRPAAAARRHRAAQASAPVSSDDRAGPPRRRDRPARADVQRHDRAAAALPPFQLTTAPPRPADRPGDHRLVPRPDPGRRPGGARRAGQPCRAARPRRIDAR